MRSTIWAMVGTGGGEGAYNLLALVPRWVGGRHMGEGIEGRLPFKEG